VAKALHELLLSPNLVHHILSAINVVVACHQLVVLCPFYSSFAFLALDESLKAKRVGASPDCFVLGSVLRSEEVELGLGEPKKGLAASVTHRARASH
jgi:hypothetical protein